MSPHLLASFFGLSLPLVLLHQIFPKHMARDTQPSTVEANQAKDPQTPLPKFIAKTHHALAWVLQNSHEKRPQCVLAGKAHVSPLWSLWRHSSGHLPGGLPSGCQVSLPVNSRPSSFNPREGKASQGPSAC
jgi:hypothetical protein